MASPWRDLWRIAGILQIDPQPYTLRQLVWMAEGRNRHVWGVMAPLMALIANCYKDPKRKNFSPNDFNPTLTAAERRRDAIVITDENVEIMREDFKGCFQNKGK